MNASSPITQISEAVSAAINPYIAENELLKESINEIRMMFDHEDAGWTAISGITDGSKTRGLSLSEVHTVSQSARARVAGSSLVKRAADLHHGYVFGNGLEIDNTEREPGKTGRPGREVTFFENAINQESIFSGAAKRELQYARFTDGNVIAFCDTREKTVRRVPISEIANVLVNPDYPDEIWAWLREWTQLSPTGEERTVQRWAYTNRFKGRKQKSISVEGKQVPVLENVTAVDLRANRQVGFTFGVPDATAGLHWAAAYGEVLRYGQIVNESLAKIVYKVVNNKTKVGAQNVGVKMGGSGFGQGAALGEGQDIQLVNSTQRSFDFTAARPLAAMAAAAWNVSNIDLLSDSSAAGSSYGAAQSLTPGMQNAMSGMRDEWTQFFEDIFEIMGFGRAGIHWPPMERPDAYRMAQELALYAPNLFDHEVRAITLDRLDIPGDPNKIPPSLKARNAAPKVQQSPDQGQSNGTGGQDSGGMNDQRTDNIGSE